MTLGKRSVAAAVLAGAAVPMAPALAHANGAASFTPAPVVSKVTCTKQCASRGRVHAGGQLKLAGRDLDGTRRVVFQGNPKTKRDNVGVRVSVKRKRAFRVRVPVRALSGPIRLVKTRHARSRPTSPVGILPPPPPERQATLSPSPGPRDPGAPMLETGVSRSKAFFAGSAVRFSYRVNAPEPVPVRIELVNVNEDSVVRTWSPGPVEPNTVHTVRWSGKPAAGQSAPAGRYVFRLTADRGGAIARSSQNENATRDAFDFYGHIFPVRGKHDYGGAGARFGAGRSGHSHQGQDVFARCGTRLVAARAGTVKFNQYHSAAGYYLIIKGHESQYDYVYMHLQERSPFKPGDKVKTGQLIGRVGETGNARGCHLHYEMWTAPGWYRGGKPIDPYSHLKLWDSWS